MDINDIISGFEAYATAEELEAGSAVDAPATTIPCAASASYITADIGC